jgi:hypothetical protein
VVRLVFLLVVLYAVAGEVVRKEVRQPYPGLFMPAFDGVGLSRMTRDEGELDLIAITVRFRDGSEEGVPRGVLFGDDFFPTVLPVKFFTAGLGADGKGPLPADAKAFLAARLAAVFPGKPVESVTFRAVRTSFPLDRPGDRRAVGVDAERVIPFSP